MLSRLGPAPALALCALLVLACGVVFGLVPIGFSSRTLTREQVLSIVFGAAVLGAWAYAAGASAWRLSRVEDAAIILTPANSPGVFDILISAPLLFIVPTASLGLPALLRAGRPAGEMVLAALLWVGLVALSETDGSGYVRDGRIHVRQGWLRVRLDSVPVATARGVLVERDSYRGAPSYVVKLDFAEVADSEIFKTVQARYRSPDLAKAEAERWRRALGQESDER